ncbi:MATE family efflux transporter [Anaerosporobacter sp.]
MMKRENTFFKTVCNIAIPVALQSMLQASFSIVDQIMIGQLGSGSVAGVGLAGKFSSIFSVLVSAIGAVAGIMISQYMGQKNKQEVRRSFFLNLLLAVGLASCFTVLCIVFNKQIMGLYTKDNNTMLVASSYLAIIAGTFLPMAGATLLSTMFRCMEKASLPLYTSIFAAILNTGLNYILIFGKFGFPQMGPDGAAIATVVSQVVNFLFMLVLLLKYRDYLVNSQDNRQIKVKFNWKQYANMLLPILVCEFMWSLGENVYAGIYGNLGTESSAAMTLINPIQGLMIGALCGLSQAASVIIGKKLGNKEYDEAYNASKKLIYYGFIGSLILSLLIVTTSSYYVKIYQVEESVKLLTKQILIAYAVIAPFKVLNMILGGGIIRSGGKTKYVMLIDLIGTCVFGVPLGLLSAFVLKLSIPYVYFILSLEECIRFGISVVIFQKKKWMQSLKAVK